MSYKVTIVDEKFQPDYAQEEKVLADLDAEVVQITGFDKDEIIKECKDADGIIVNLAGMSSDIIDQLQKCRVISRYGVGVDSVDVEAATKKKIWVANVPDYCDEDVSDQAMALLVGCVRNVALRDKQVRGGTWDIKSAPPQRRIKGKTVVLFGYGNIAKTMHRKISGFLPGRVLVCDPYVDEKTIAEAGAEKVDFDTAVSEGDLFSLHMPLNEETRGYFNSGVFEKMKPTAIIVNTSRGPIIDENDLYKALSEGTIQSAGLDVFTNEPVEKDNPLLTLDNITVSGHTGFYTEESQVELKRKAALNVLDTLSDGKPTHPVNQI